MKLRLQFGTNVFEVKGQFAGIGDPDLRALIDLWLRAIPEQVALAAEIDAKTTRLDQQTAHLADVVKTTTPPTTEEAPNGNTR